MQKGLQFTTMFTEVNFFCRKVTLDVVVQGQFHQALSSMPRLLAVSTTTCALLQEYTIQRQVFVRTELLEKLNFVLLKLECCGSEMFISDHPSWIIILLSSFTHQARNGYDIWNPGSEIQDSEKTFVWSNGQKTPGPLVPELETQAYHMYPMIPVVRHRPDRMESLDKPPASLAFLPSRASSRTRYPTLLAPQCRYEAILVWSYTTFIVYEAAINRKLT